MTTVETAAHPSKQVLDRRQVVWGREPSLVYDRVIEIADAELADEARVAAESQAWAQEMAESVRRMRACSSCGAPAGWNIQTALCRPCHLVLTQIETEEAATDRRRDLVEQYRRRKSR